jgi:DNA-binding Lrp family transcriptional regulator
MNTLDKDILNNLLTEEMSIYKLQKKVNKPYPTVWRHVKKLQKEKYIAVFTVEADGRNTQMVSLTPKGMVMLVFEGDIGKHWASNRDQEKSFEDFLNMLSQVAKASKTSP